LLDKNLLVFVFACCYTIVWLFQIFWILHWLNCFLLLMCCYFSYYYYYYIVHFNWFVHFQTYR